MDDIQNGLLNVAIGNFSNAQQANNVSAALQLVFLGLQQVSGAVANQVSDSLAQQVARLAAQTFSQELNAVTGSFGLNDATQLAVGLQQLTAAMRALS